MKITNSSSVPASAVQPCPAARSTCCRRISRGDTRTGCPDVVARSHWIITLPGRCGIRLIVE
ncbi:hypothetical protein [Microbacterium sp. OVT16B]|uniref:hypothetical protein n=1 Tax=Microbacterium sp. OVT16B TaxID=2862682 RepID=UPI001CBDDF40|nr:hypothetical protein [Microbacterium sp. OVT16B]